MMKQISFWLFAYLFRSFARLMIKLKFISSVACFVFRVFEAVFFIVRVCFLIIISFISLLGALFNLFEFSVITSTIFFKILHFRD